MDQDGGEVEAVAGAASPSATPALGAPQTRPKARSGVARISVFVLGIAAILGGLECRPSMVASEATARAEVEIKPEPPVMKGRWAWPGRAAFDAKEASVLRDARPIRVLWGRTASVEGVALSIAPHENGKFSLWVEFTQKPDDHDNVHLSGGDDWMLVGGELPVDGGKAQLTFASGSNQFEIEGVVSPLERPSPSAVRDWAYVATAVGEEALYVEKPSSDYSREKEIKATLARGDKEGAIALFQGYRPMGHCSMDTHPAEVARQYAEACYDAGKLSCFLQLQIRIMGDQFDRVAYSSYGEESHETQSARLFDTGIDVPRFFRGLALHFTGVSRKGNLGSWRLARSAKESGKAATLAAAFVAMAQDQSLDDYNRLRATAIVANMDEEKLLSEGRLTEVSRALLAMRRESRKAKP